MSPLELRGPSFPSGLMTARSRGRPQGRRACADVGTIGRAHDDIDRTLRGLQEDFIASVSHELQTPLTSVRGGLGLLDAAIGETLGPAEREMLSATPSGCGRRSGSCFPRIT